MKIFSKLQVLVFAGLVALFSACGEKGETGDPGPMGPPGNANVYSFYYSVNYTSWSVYGAPGTPNHSLYFDKYIPEITQEIIDYGMVVAYIWDVDINAWVALPYTYTFAGTQEYYKFYTTAGIAGIDISLSTLQTPIPQTSIDVKVVAVAGYVRQQNPDLDWSNYEMVKERLNLE
jgi:hypothetical protein